MNPTLRRQLGGFLVSGILSSGCYAGVIAGLVELGGLSELPATVAGFVVGTLVSWVANSMLSFQSPLSRRTLWRFTAVTLVGLGLNLAIMKGVLSAGFPYGVGIFLVLTTVPAVNFVLHRMWTYVPARCAQGDVTVVAIPATASRKAVSPRLLA